MLRLLDLGRPDLLAYRVSGVLSDHDVRTATRALDRVLGEHPTVHVYAEVEAVRGVEARALIADLVYSVTHVGSLLHIGRVALATDTAWVRRLALAEALLLPIGEVEFFSLEEREDARNWVLAAPEASGETGTTTGTTEAPARARASGAVPPSPIDHAPGDDHCVAGARGAWADDRARRPREGDSGRHRPRPRAPRFGHTLHRTHALLHRIADRLETEGTQPAYHALRAVLPALRDRLPASEAADLAAQLTLLVRGVFYEDYRPERAPEASGAAADFLADVRSGLGPGVPVPPEAAAAAVGGALAATVSVGEWAQVLGALPDEVRALLAPEAEAVAA